MALYLVALKNDQFYKKMQNLLLHKIGYSYSYLDSRYGPHRKNPSHPSPSRLCSSLCDLTASLKYFSNLCLCVSLRKNPFDWLASAFQVLFCPAFWWLTKGLSSYLWCLRWSAKGWFRWLKAFVSLKRTGKGSPFGSLQKDMLPIQNWWTQAKAILC